ncbi:MAG: SOS-response transcriptional repressor, LexA [Candidatus Saccharibacteria bacterium]|nr:SOS-response transcriptional repressor, LexA [Candidatus Saccharibacteria bacterium]
MVNNERSTKRQRELLTFVDGFIQGHGYGPSYREIMRALGYKSVSTVAIHIDGLITKGYLRKRDNSARSLEVVTTNTAIKETTEKPTAAQERWLVAAVNRQFDLYDEKKEQMVLDGIYVLVGALKVLGLDKAHEAAKARLGDLEHL